jgi:alkylresorcinol/alkylpyrone synthase
VNPKILSTHIALPPYSRPTSDALPYVEEWLQDQDERFRKKVLRIFKYAQVDHRYSIMDIDEVFKETSFEEKNAFYAKEYIKLTHKAVEGALEKANLAATDLDFIISVSCTGVMIPSIDAYLINSLKMRQDIVRLPVMQMGCAGGTSALIYAHNLLKANPGKRAAIVAFESPTSTFQHQDMSMVNMVSAAIFGDGAVCTILGPSDELKPAIVDGEMYHFYDEVNMMGFNLRNTGLQMILDKSVPDKIEKHFPQVIFPFLEKNHLSIEDINHLIFHPGGKKIVQIVEGLFHQLGKNIDDTKAVLKEYGNMSSATVLYVLERFLNREIPENDLGLMLSFGPGFSAQRLLLKWEK